MYGRASRCCNWGNPSTPGRLAGDRTAAQPKRVCRTARRLYEDLWREGYGGAYDSVQRFVTRWRNPPPPLTQAFVPLLFAPGEACQFDFSEEEVALAGR